MRRTLLSVAILSITCSANADTILFEDFEDATITYTSSLPDDLGQIANRDYYGRLAPDTATPPVDVSYSNAQGSGYYGAQDTDNGNLNNPSDFITLDWTGIDISNHENLDLSWYVAEDDAGDGNEDWDTTSSFRILAQIDGGGFFDVFAIESELGGDGNETNELARVDTDFDGTGDGVEITDAFTQFNAALANGSVLDIRVEIQDLDTGDEDIAFDNLLLQGDFVGAAVPEPSTFAFLLFGGLGLGLRRRRDAA